MLSQSSRLPAALALFAALLGLVFASYSTVDYATHLDRNIHDLHCSFVPGAAATSEAEACRAALYSPYSALLKDQLWGGIPISLFAMGAFAFFAAFALYLLIAGPRASKVGVVFFAAVSVTPLLVSAVMFLISVTQLGTVCKTCAGIYIASLLLCIGGVLGLFGLRESASAPPRGKANPLLAVAWLGALGLVTLLPSAVYAASAPNHDAYLTQCGQIKQGEEAHGALVQMRTAESRQPALLFEDPLCPSCKAFHERLVGEGVFDKLDVKLSLFPLDSACNWMLDQALHPGACLLSKAVLCGGDQARAVLEWAYEEQVYLTRAGKAGEPTLREVIRQRWGANMMTCIDDRATDVRLNNHLHFASANAIPISTPQMYLGKQRVCDADTDIGLRYALSRLAPEVL